MNESNRGKLLAQAQRAAAAAETNTRLADGVVPQAGDLLVVPSTGDWPVEWVVLERAGDQLLLAPADPAPQQGPGDFSIDGDPGPLRVRCAWARWLPAAVLAAASHSGRLTPPMLDAARALAAAKEGQRFDPATLGYRQWIESTIAPACAALDGAAQNLTNVPPRQPASWRWPARLAAALLLVVLGGFLQNLIGSHSEPGNRSGVQVGIDYAILHPAGSLRGAATEVPLERQATSTLHLIALLPSGLRADAVVLQLNRTGEGEAEEIWRGRVVVSDRGEADFTIAAEKLSAGLYNLRLVGDSTTATADDAVEYVFEIVDR